MTRQVSPLRTLAAALRDPARLADATLAEWDGLIPTARRLGLLARLAHRLECLGGLETVPGRVHPHLLSAKLLAEKHRRDVWREIRYLEGLLGPPLGRLILLKGAAYTAADLPPAAGRLFNDLDILVPRRDLAQIEALLGIAGWRIGEINQYDDAYYRRWMHQIPPLTNASRSSVIDVHHSILPMTARSTIDPAPLLEAALPVAGSAALAVLAPADMVLHCAVHLFSEGRFDRGLRDLDDFNLLVRRFSQDGSFWGLLAQRAKVLRLGRFLFYALRYATALLGTPIPHEIIREFQSYRRRTVPMPAMDLVFHRAFAFPPAGDLRITDHLANFLLYVRGHYLRMPFYLLMPHLTKKAILNASHSRSARSV